MSVFVKNFCLCLLFVCVFSVAVNASHLSDIALTPLAHQPDKQVALKTTVFNDDSSQSSINVVNITVPLHHTLISCSPPQGWMEVGAGNDYCLYTTSQSPIPIGGNVEFSMNVLSPSGEDSHNFVVKTQDEVGGADSSQVTTYTDRTPPTGSITSPASYSWFKQNQPFNLNVDCHDTLSGCSGIAVVLYHADIIHQDYLGKSYNQLLGWDSNVVVMNLGSKGFSATPAKPQTQFTYNNFVKMTGGPLSHRWNSAYVGEDATIAVWIMDAAGNSRELRLPIKQNFDFY